MIGNEDLDYSKIDDSADTLVKIEAKKVKSSNTIILPTEKSYREAVVKKERCIRIRVILAKIIPD